ncbi:MAG: hypothetical protein ACPIOQ_43940, partial [Promethearchaeia archaeon]
MAEEEAAQDVAPASGAAEPEEGAAEAVSDLGPPPEVLDYYISYRETDSNGYSDKDVASRLAGALQRASGVNGEPVSVFAPDGDPIVGNVSSVRRIEMAEARAQAAEDAARSRISLAEEAVVKA